MICISFAGKEIMKKKNKNKRTKLEKETNRTYEKGPSESFSESELFQKPFDSGGWPDRDLKKNLGCG
jgi:hypothetical protein